MKRAVIALAPGFEEVEALTAVDLLRRAGVEVILAAVSDELQVTGARRIPVVCQSFFRELDLQQADLLILPGGMPGTTNLEADSDVMAAIESYDKAGKYIGAICAAPAILLGKHGFLKGREATCYPGMETEFVEARHTTDMVAVSDYIITSRGVGTSLEFACTLIEKLCGREKAEEIARSVVYTY